MTWPAPGHRLFPDLDLAIDSDLPVRNLIWERLLEDGTREDLCAWFHQTPPNESVEWLRAKGDRLSSRSYSFWRWLLDVDQSLAARQQNPYWPDTENGRL